MMIWTHTCFTLFLVSDILYIAGIPVDIGIILFAFLGNLLPDIDTTDSALGSVMSPVSKFIEGKWGHRTVTHSFLFIVFSAALFSPLVFIFETKYYMALLFGILGHIMGDELTVSGVQFWFPSKVACVAWRDRRWRFVTGSKQENVVFVSLLCLNLVFLPIYSWGMETTLYYFDKGLDKAINYARNYFQYYKIYITIDADWMVRQSLVEDDRLFEIIAIEPMALYVRDMTDRRTVYNLSGSPFSGMIVRKVYIRLGDAIRRYSIGRQYSSQKFEMSFLIGQNLDDVMVNGSVDILPNDNLQAFISTMKTSTEAQQTLSYIPLGDKVAKVEVSKATGSIMKEIFEDNGVFIVSGNLDFLITEPDKQQRITDMLHLRLFQ